MALVSIYYQRHPGAPIDVLDQARTLGEAGAKIRPWRIALGYPPDEALWYGYTPDGPRLGPKPKDEVKP